MSYSIEQLDYIQRIGASRPLTSPVDFSRAFPAQARELWVIKGVGRIEKDAALRKSDSQKLLPSEDVLIALYGSSIPIAYSVYGESGRVSVEIGTWVRGPNTGVQTEALSRKQQVLRSALNSLYPSLELEPKGEIKISLAPRAGLVIGMPTTKAPDPSDQALPLDRLIRAMSGANWAFLLLAHPATSSMVSQQRSQIIEEMRLVESGARGVGAASPLAEHYEQVLKMALFRLTSGFAVGAWHTALYLLGDRESYPRLSSSWVGIFSGEESLPEPVQVLDNSSAAQLAVAWAMPTEPGPPGPGRYKHPFQYQTLLTSTQLAAYVHLPHLEWNGFSVKMVPAFDAVPPKAPKPSIQLGKVIPRDRSTPREKPDGKRVDEWVREQYNSLPQTHYEFGVNSLTKHVFVAGVTGAGKTRTLFHILKSAFSSKPSVPFLVIEPAKTEYRELMRHEEIGDRLQVFTLGNENISPFRLNPFEMSEGTPVGVHIELLRSVFSASFGWWNPVPQVFEKCAQLLYQDKGWDVASDFNRRNNNRDKTDFRVFPTLSDLVTKADEVVPTLGYDPEATGRVQGHFRATLLGLRSGAKGRMLDVQRSLPMSVLLQNPCVLELEGLGDDDDKAFMMGLLLIRLAEYRRSPEDKAEGANNRGLRHLLVFEEAHRLLTNVAVRGEEGATNPRAKAVECFSNLLAEIRKYGQGVIVTDQVPTKLAPDVIKNTNLKIAHRIVDEPDRQVLAGSMVMTKQQALTISTLLPGQAAVFAEGDDSPLLVHVVPGNEVEPFNEQALRNAMSASKVLAPCRDIFPAHVGCADLGEHCGTLCEAARAIVESPVFQRDFIRLVLSSIEDKSAPGRLWASIEWHVKATITDDSEDEATRADRLNTLMRCLCSRAAQSFASRRGDQAGWSFKVVAELSEAVEQFLLSQITKSEGGKSAQLALLVKCLNLMQKRNFPPYSHCEEICTQEEPVCLYRHAISDIVNRGDFTGRWVKSDPFSGKSLADAWAVCLRVAEQLVELNMQQQQAIRRIGLCYSQMMLFNDALNTTPEFRSQVFERISQESESWALRAYA